MLAVETADENLFVPESEVASLTPVYPDRTRVVLADGTVGHFPGPPPAGPWVPLQDSWVTPHLLTRQADFWKDPADYLYAYAPLANLEIEEQESDLPEGLIAFEKHDGSCYWRTDLGLEPSDLTADQADQLYPELCLIGKNLLVDTRRVRRYGMTSKGPKGWFLLDNGERFEFPQTRFPAAYHALGVESLSVIRRNHPTILRTFRDFPYDLTSGDSERIRKDCPTPQSLLYNLIWQTVLLNLRGQTNDYGKDTDSFTLHPVATAAGLAGYSLKKKDVSLAFSYLIHGAGLIHFSQLGFTEPEPIRRFLGKTRPEVLLVASHEQAEAVLPVVERSGISLLLSEPYGDRISLEKLVPQLPTPFYVAYHHLDQTDQEKITRILDHLDAAWIRPPVQLDLLSELDQAITSLPKPYLPSAPEPFRRIPLQADESSLLLVDSEEIAAWSPSRFDRWRVVLADGRVLHHPGPVPAGPWVACGEHWVQPHLIDGTDPAGFPIDGVPEPPPLLPVAQIQGGPALPCPAEAVVCLQEEPDGAYWGLEDGSKIPAGMAGELAAPHHPGLVRLSRTGWVRPNKIRATRRAMIQLEGGFEFELIASFHVYQLRLLMGIASFDRLAPDPHNLLGMQIRDYPFEINRAPAAVLRQHFSNAQVLICNLLYQSFDMSEKTGIPPYGTTFSAYFYRPIQSTLYRIGFLRRAQMRARWRKLSAKDRYRRIFTQALFSMVYQYRLFTYRQFGFKDPCPRDRLFGSTRPQKILLVEKGDRLEEYGRQLQQEFGVTLVLLEGCPRLSATEYLAEELKKRGISEVQVAFYGDYDYAGWDIGPALIRQLRFYGLQCSRFARLVLPECFSTEELANFSRPIHITAANIASRVRRWLGEGGGIKGEARGIHANWLAPYPRLVSRFQEFVE